MSQALEDWRRSVVRVCDGRGFIVETEREGRFIITAANCLPHLPPSHASSCGGGADNGDRPGMVEYEEAKGLGSFLTNSIFG